MEFLIAAILMILGFFAVRKLAPTLPIPGTDAFAFRQTFRFTPSRLWEMSPAEHRFMKTVIESRANKLQLAEIDLDQAQRSLDQSANVTAMGQKRRELRKTRHELNQVANALQASIDLAVIFAGDEFFRSIDLPGHSPSEKSLTKSRALAGSV